MNRIYISGQISGIEGSAFEIFDKAEKELYDKGFISVVNPMKIEHKHDKSWESYMKEDIKALCDCNHIFMLRNWKNSRGASIERLIAVSIGIKVIYEQ